MSLVLFRPTLHIALLFSACLGAFAFVAHAVAAEPVAPPKVHLVGDSTMADKPIDPPNPEHGWGQLFPRYFKDPAMVINYAMNGRSTKSFRDEGLWDKAIAAVKPGDFMIIQFGHNDEKKDNPKIYAEAQTAFRENLIRFVREVRSKSAFPILATPVNRRNFDASGHLVDTHGEYPEVVREVAKAEKVPLLDLHRSTRPLLEKYGPEASKKLFVWVKPGEYARHPEGREDNTHFSELGATLVAGLAADEIRAQKLPLAHWLK